MRAKNRKKTSFWFGDFWFGDFWFDNLSNMPNTQDQQERFFHQDLRFAASEILSFLFEKTSKNCLRILLSISIET